jgi:hypothetical protein
VLEKIMEQRPRELYVAADGPREGREGDAGKCAHTRALLDAIPSSTVVHRLFREKNLGCRRAVSSGISWFFSEVEQGIILEDDTLPDPSFFDFCEAALQRYASEERVKIVSGHNPQVSTRSASDVVFSRYPEIWGWATWRRTWRDYEVELRDWPSAEVRKCMRVWLRSRHAETFWANYFDYIKNGLDTWDVQLNYLLYRQRGLAAVARTNLVRNIGFFADATHTVDPDDQRKSIPAIPLVGPPSFPGTIEPDERFDAWLVENRYQSEQATLRGRIKEMLRRPRAFLRSKADS